MHAAWEPRSGRMAIWGESDQAGPGRRRTGFHPFAASHRQLTETWPALADLAEAGDCRLKVPTGRGRPCPSTPTLSLEPTEPRSLRAWPTPCLWIAPADALRLLAAEAGGAAADDLVFWRLAARWALDLLVGGRFLPTLRRQSGGWHARWQPRLDPVADQARRRTLADAMPSACRAAAARDPGPRALLDSFIDAVIDGFARESARFEALALPQRFQGRDLAAHWLWALSGGERRLRATLGEGRTLCDWARPRRADAGAARLCLRLDVPQRDRRWPLQFLLQSQAEPSLMWPADDIWSNPTRRSLPADGGEALLAGLGLAARLASPIERGLQMARPTGVALDTDEAVHFIQEGSGALRQAGIGVLIPNFERALGLKVAARKARASTKGRTSAGLTADTILRFDWQIAIGESPLSARELAELARLKTPLVEIRGQWVLVDPEQLSRAQSFMAAQREGATLAGALPLLLRAESGSGLPIVDVKVDGALRDWIERLTGQGRLRALPPPAGLTATLRPYQQLGYSWLDFLSQLGFGACLADDMGLGKTVQTLAYLVKRRADGECRPGLIVCPTSVVANWEREAARFAPELRALVHHGSDREKQDLPRLARRHDLVLTSYALLVRDQAQLLAIDWGELVLDEAQNIKNAETKQARAARALRAAHRLALTGTPIENRLSELWSLFHFLNPGYLGSAEHFRNEYARPIERAGVPAQGAAEPDAAAEPRERLRRLIAPFVLRRLKTDTSIINDLPAKHEMKVYCSLTREQASLYQAVVSDSLDKIASSEGIQRRGLILAAMLYFKQVCNHPAHYLADGSPLPGRSGKLERLVEMLEEVRGAGERALVFTQFSEMGALLRDHLRATLGAEVLYLYGGTPARERARLVERFQQPGRGPLAFVLSIKAGGTGLNLTGANHVFHFDRWWNPAVENQATDRAFRIGQTRRVQVHKYICAGTIEDKIDALIESKRGLANAIVGASESWVTELSTAQLRELFSLRQDAVMED